MNEPLRILQIGMGPLGVKIAQYIDQKKSMNTVAAVDINPILHNKDLGILCGNQRNNVAIKPSLSQVDNIHNIDAAILTTTSSFQKIAPQLVEIINYGIPIVSTCEELTFPWQNDPRLAKEIDDLAKESNVAVVSTGVNPGFLMDTLPTMLTAVSKDVSHISVKRIQDAHIRRVPFQKKIGAGLSLEEFEKRKIGGTLRHVGLTESMQFIADSLKWKLDKVEDIISPIVAKEQISTEAMNITPGQAMGVRQIGRAFVNGEEKINLLFEAAVGLGESYDEIEITGEPNISSRIKGGVNGDIATCSIVLNVIPVLLKATPGLNTMKNLGLVSFTN